MKTVHLKISLQFYVSFHQNTSKVQDCCTCIIKADLHSANVSREIDAIHWRMVFFESRFEANEMFCLFNKFVLFTN